MTLPDERTLIVTATAIPAWSRRKAAATVPAGDRCPDDPHVRRHLGLDLCRARHRRQLRPRPHSEAEVTAAPARAFLDEWIKVDIASSDTAPAMDAEGVTTTLSKEDFEAIKASKAPMVCFKGKRLSRPGLAPDSIGFIIPFFERAKRPRRAMDVKDSNGNVLRTATASWSSRT